jgi:hypothetical protein
MNKFLKPAAALIPLFAAASMLCACSGTQEAMNADASLQTPNLTVPASGITPVKEVIVTPRENDTLEVTAAANGSFKFEQLTAVLWCRAGQYAKQNKSEWQAIKIEQLREATEDQPMVGRGLVQLSKPAKGHGKKAGAKDWCKDVPKVASS